MNLLQPKVKKLIGSVFWNCTFKKYFLSTWKTCFTYEIFPKARQIIYYNNLDKNVANGLDEKLIESVFWNFQYEKTYGVFCGGSPQKLVEIE